MDSSATQNNSAATATHLRVESRPSQLYAARYNALPFPQVGPLQEVAFDLGITAYNGKVRLGGVVFKGYNDHQMLFEQRWPARIVQKHTGEDDLTIPPETGLALRALHFMIHGHESLTLLEITVVGKEVSAGDEDESAGEQSIQAVLRLPVLYPEQKTDLHFPLRGAWWAIQAADWSDQHKMEVMSQPYAIDFVKLGSDSHFFRGKGLTLEDHYSWGQPVYAAAGGKVAFVSYDMPDIQPGTLPDPRMFRDDPRRLLGNAIGVSHANGEFSYFAHLQQLSAQVREGDLIKRGTLLGRIGNSGHSPGPHLHFHLMEGPNLFIDQGLPVKFSHFSAGGQFFDSLMTIPTRMIVHGPEEP